MDKKTYIYAAIIQLLKVSHFGQDDIYCCHVDRLEATEIVEELLQRAEKRGDEREEVTTNNRADRADKLTITQTDRHIYIVGSLRCWCCLVDSQGATEELLQRAEQRGDEREEVRTEQTDVFWVTSSEELSQFLLTMKQKQIV